jgi:uncharacterized protein (TIGR03083 family)
METPGIIETAHLYGPLHEQLILLLESLAPEDWSKPTVCRGWAVRDIAAHILDSYVRRLSVLRDEHDMPPPDPPIASYTDLVGFLNRLNADWVAVCRRLSPPVLVDFLRVTGTQVASHAMTMDMQAPARFSVAWAGEEVSRNWFGIARDYTEQWHHQQQIRDAVGAPGLASAYWLGPVLETFLRALPHAYRDVPGVPGDAIEIRIEGEAGGAWTLERAGPAWKLRKGVHKEPLTKLSLDQDTAWRHFTKGISPDEAKRRIRVEGDPALAEPYYRCLAIMA